MDKAKALQVAFGNFDARMHLSALPKEDLAWWIDHVCSSHKPTLAPDPDLTMFTDASGTVGWGAVLKDQQRGGAWSHAKKSHHINYLELQAVFLASGSWASLCQHKYVRVMADNQTAVAVLNHVGSSQSRPEYQHSLSNMVAVHTASYLAVCCSYCWVS